MKKVQASSNLWIKIGPDPLEAKHNTPNNSHRFSPL